MILAVVLGVIALGLMIFLIYIQVTAYQATRQAISEEEAAIAKAKARVEELRQLAAQAEELREQEALLSRLIPTQPEEDRLIEEIRGMAVAAETRLLEFRLDEPVEKDEYTEVPLELAFEGEYRDLLALLASLAEGPRAVRLDEIKVSRGAACLAGVKADVEAAVFYRSEKASEKAKTAVQSDEDEKQVM